MRGAGVLILTNKSDSNLVIEGYSANHSLLKIPGFIGTGTCTLTQGLLPKRNGPSKFTTTGLVSSFLAKNK